MRIAYFSDTFLPKIDGVVVSLVNFSAELGKRGHSVKIFCPSPGRGKKIDWRAKNVDLFSVASLPVPIYPEIRLGAPTPRSLIRLRKFKPDVIHLKTPAFMGLDGLLGGKALGVPIIGTFNTYFMEPEYLKLVKLDKYRRISKFLWEFAVRFYNNCDAVVVPTKIAGEDIKSHGLKKPIYYIPNGVEIKKFSKVDSASVRKFKKKYGVGKSTVIYVGRLSKEKSLEILIEAFALVVYEIEEAQLLIVGDGPTRTNLEAFVSQLGLEKSVIFTGAIGNETLIRSGVFQAATIFCTPSNSETQGLSVVEAMAAGLPIVGVKARGVMELVKGNGVVVNPGDSEALAKAIVNLFRSEKKLRSYSARSKEHAKQFSMEKIGDKLERLYSSFIKSRSKLPRERFLKRLFNKAIK